MLNNISKRSRASRGFPATVELILFTDLSRATAASVLTEALTETPWRYGDILQIVGPNHHSTARYQHSFSPLHDISATLSQKKTSPSNIFVITLSGAIQFCQFLAETCPREFKTNTYIFTAHHSLLTRALYVRTVACIIHITPNIGPHVALFTFSKNVMFW